MDEKVEVTQDQLKQLALDAVASYVKETGMDKTDQKYIVSPDVDEKEQLKLDKKERFGKIMKALVAKDYLTVQTLTKTADPNNMTTDGDGGYLVPDETRAEIIGLIPSFGQARRFMTVQNFPINRDYVNIPARSTGITVYYPGEQGSITSSKLALTTVQLQAKKAAAIAVLTNELRDMAIVDFVNYINTRAAEAFAIDEDSKVFGTTNTYFTGLFYKTQTFGKEVSVASFDGVSYENLLEAVYGLDPAYLNNAAWYCHRTQVQYLRGIKDNNDRPLFYEANAGGFPTLMGYPVRMIENGAPSSAATGEPFLLLGNLANSFLYEKQMMRIDLSGDAVVDSTSLFQTDLTAIRFIRHWGFNPGLVAGYAVLQVA